MLTIIGALFLMAAAWFLWRGEGRLLGLLVFASIFEASSAINFGKNGVQPYFFVACIFVLSQYKHLPKLKGVMTRSGKGRLPGAIPLLLFVIVSISTAFICPFHFAGLPVYAPTISMDEGLLHLPSLAFGLTNVIQSAYLILNSMVLVSAFVEKRNAHIESFVDFTFYFLGALLFLQFIFQYFKIPFPYSLIQNNPGYSMAETSIGDISARLSGTFPEPSGVGLALAIFYGGYFFRYYHRSGSIGKVILSIVLLGMTRSSSSILAMVVITGLIVLANPPFRLPYYVRPKRLLRIVIICLIPVVVALTSLRGIFSAQTTQKTGTESFISRIAADLYSLQLASATHWLGVGLGSNRPSSLLPSLLSTVGLLGTVLFALLIFRLLRHISTTDAWVRWALIAAVVDMGFGVSDINQPLLWSSMALAVYYANQTDIAAHEDQTHSSSQLTS